MSDAVQAADEEREQLSLAIADGRKIEWRAVSVRALLTVAEIEALRTLESLRPAPSAGNPLMPGARVADFHLVSMLGEGGMGQVWEAVQLSLDRHVAIKFVRHDHITSNLLELFAREARAGGRLSHPGLVTIHGHGQAGDHAWIAMELVRGGRTVRTLIKERQLSVSEHHDREAAELVARIAEAMQAAHESGVIHRDLKPENLLIDPLGRPHVTDFGLARIESESALSISGLMLGTCYYMSPEHVGGKRSEIDARTDIFSLGVVLYELLALRRPFEGDTALQVVDNIRTLNPLDPRTFRSRVPRDLALIAARALEKDPRRRFQSMEEFAADLRRFLADVPIRSRPPSRAYRLKKWAQRNPALGTAAAVILACFAAVCVLLVENLRTNRMLEQERNQLDLANRALLAKTIQAETSARQATEQSRLAGERLVDVLRLSALQQLDELEGQAEQLWPVGSALIEPCSRWIDQATRLAQQLPEYRRDLEQLRAQAVAASVDEPQQLPLSDPRREQLERDRRHLASLRRVATSALSGLPVQNGPVPLLELLPGSVEDCLALAWPWIDPDRTDWGSEELGLALARRALELSDEEQRPRARFAVAWALLALGHFDAAIEQGELALDEASPAERELHENGLDALVRAAERHLDDEGLGRDQAELERLEQQIASLEREMSAPERWYFPNQEDRWLHDELARLVAELEALIEPVTGLLSAGTSPEHGWGIPKRLSVATTLRDRSVTGPAAQAAWAEARRSIADPGECPLYRGLLLEPQEGLLPIGRDPGSGLWEFVDLQTGEAPRVGADGAVIPDETMGVVFVLLPGGPTFIGSQATKEGAPYHYPESPPEEGPVHEVVLSPFFLSKYEMTQGQWIRFTGSNPSYVTAATWLTGQSRGGTWTPRLPVEQVNWFLCSRVARRLGMSLPTEAQWEYAARAGTTTPWWCGEEKDSIPGSGNLADLHAREHGGSSWAGHEPWDDGHSATAPVGSFRPNAFGLHDVIGNVWEWCLDTYQLDFYRVSPRFDPVSEQPGLHATRVWRGGGANERAAEARSGHRAGLTPDGALWALGLRPARQVARSKAATMER